MTTLYPAFGATFRQRAAAVVATVVLCVAPAVANAQALVFDSGHIDAFNVTADPSGALYLDLKEDVTGSHVQRAPEEVVIAVGDHAYTTGTEQLPGIERATWYLPQTQASDLPWPGWDTNGVRAGGFEAIDITFVDVTGPGTIFLYVNDTFGGTAPVTADGALWLYPGSYIHQAAPAHVHANWGFDAPGTYQLTVVASGTNAAGAYVESNAATYTFVVGSGDAAPAPVEGEQAAGAPGAPAANAAAGAPNAPGAATAGAPKAPGAATSGAAKAPGAAAKSTAAAKAPGAAGTSSTRARGASSTSSEEVDDGWAWWTWVLLIGGIVLLAAGTAGLWWQVRNERAEEDDALGDAGSYPEVDA
ncbi:choice-of-anchor M domain-containing protein [Corynebacterium uterequi]|uniref:Actinobacterial surface-anchored protein domain n=1 Tax=Corynebacterium uterequi TaxID=1072256 RepID=A0A0G3HFH9_9CORY|nr:choice-of-anchor M domain-containing protein [Corynebacterium uterequi]AKK12069.1 actinobacterial surface-anchored protein domain [Corynebacterium uterequi]